MTDLLIKAFIKDKDNVKDPAVREKYGILSGTAGIIVNAVLCIAKFFAGTVTNSIAITADAVNNLSDAGSSAVTVFGFRLSGRPADTRHPFGHGRIEYITAMAVSFIILFMGIELASQSIDKIIHPEDVRFSMAGAIIIGVSILGKLWLALFNKKLGRKIDSPAMTAVVADSISDMAATGITLIALILSKFFPHLHIDGWLGIIVACFVLKAGYEIFKETMSVLIGEPPKKETVDELKNIILSHDRVAGFHDLILHNYGPGRSFGSVHVEMPSDLDVMTGHDIIDNIERDIAEKTGIQISIHYDPIEINNERVTELKKLAVETLESINPEFSLHDFRVVDGNTHTNLIFDVVVPPEYEKEKNVISGELSKKISEKNKSCFCVINVEHSFV